MHKNKLNNKVYIGITGRNPEARWANGNGYKYNLHFYRSIQKYGWDGFEHIILEDDLTREEAKEKEIYYIKKYNSTNQDNGYNISRGGDLSSASTVKQYDRFTGKFLHEWDCTISAEKALNIPNADISAVCNGKMKTSHNFYFSYKYLGEFLPQEIYKWINTNDWNVPVAQYDLSGNFLRKFDTIVDAKKFLGLKNGETLEFKNKTSRGYIWRRLDKTNPTYPLKLPDKEIEYAITSEQGQICFQYDLNGKFIRSYKSVTEATEILNGWNGGIAAACRKEYFQSLNYIWRYEQDGYIYGKDLPESEIKYVHGLSKPVYQYDLNGILLHRYDSVTEAANKYGIATTNISKACNKEIKTTTGYIWRYDNVIFTEDELKDINSNKKKRKVSQYTMSGEFVNTYPSLAEAYRQTGVKDTTIRECCIGNYKHAGGYKWEYITT